MKKNTEKKLNGTVIVTYRCNARCSMCNRYKAPSKPEEEISLDTIKKLPKMYFTNITGGEPFIRTDLKDIVRELYKKSDRIVISTNGFFTDRIVDLCKEFPNIGIRISIEGLEETNNEIRGLQNGYQRGYGTLKKLREMGMKDVGFGMTVQDKNAPDLVPLYQISNEMGMEFATASLHNSFYFVEAKNIIHDRPMVAKNFEKLVNELLRSNSPKKWFRAYFNHGLINYIYGQKRLLPCDMSFDTFFIDPYGDVMPCNGTKDTKDIISGFNETREGLHNIDELNEVVRPGLGAKIFRKSILTEDMFYESTIFEDLYTTYIYLDKCSNFFYSAKCYYTIYHDIDSSSLSSKPTAESFAKSLEMILMVHEKLEKSSLRYSLELWMALLFTTYWKARVKNDTSYNSKMINDSIQKIAGILKENKIVIKPSGKKHIKVLIYKMLLMISKKKCE